MSITSLVACDLDRTLIYSKKALWLTGQDKDAPPMVVVEVYDGAPQSYMTRKAEELLRELHSKAAFVPVTTRTQAQYERVRLPGPIPEYAITSNGGVILHRGIPDQKWQQHLAARLAENCAPLDKVEQFLSKSAFSAWILRLRRAEDLFVYAIVNREIIPDSFILELEQVCAGFGWSVSIQGRKLYCVPLPLTKDHALAEVARRLGSARIFAAGDSLLDQGMLENADLAFRPVHGELHDAGYLAPNLILTSIRGVMAGEEILRRLLEEVRFRPEHVAETVSVKRRTGSFSPDRYTVDDRTADLGNLDVSR